MNSFEAVLSRMRQAVGDGISTIEGTFGGDILQAVACELARIYSQEMDTVAQRAFVQSADGQWLDAACADYGVERKEGESDDALRDRTLTKIRAQASGGNEAHYRAWATELEGVKAAQAKGLVRGPGTVDVYIMPENPDAGDELLARVRSHIEGNRPVCVDTLIAYASPVKIDVSAQLVLAGSASVAGVQAEFEAALAEYLGKTALSDRGSIISLTRIAGLLMDCAGVLDARDLRLCGQAQSLALPDGSYGTAGQCSFAQAVTA